MGVWVCGWEKVPHNIVYIRTNRREKRQTATRHAADNHGVRVFMIINQNANTQDEPDQYKMLVKVSGRDSWINKRLLCVYRSM